MTKRRKRLERIRQSPKHVSQDDLEQVLADYGFVKRAGKGSHTVFQHPDEANPITVAVHGKHVPVYIVKQVLAAIDQIIRREALEEAEDESEND
jgi:predicted RNA binding protein YcfA (HicA-like mRNA interferase family)